MLETAAAELRHAPFHRRHEQISGSRHARTRAQLGELLALAQNLLQLSLEAIKKLRHTHPQSFLLAHQSLSEQNPRNPRITGHDLSDYKATLLTREAVQQADLILTMARHHRTRVEELGGAGKTHLLGEYVGRTGDDAEVSDPFGSDLPIYRETYAELEAMIDKAVERLIGSERDPDPR